MKDGKDVTFTVRSIAPGRSCLDLDPDRKPSDPILALRAAFLWPNDRPMPCWRWTSRGRRMISTTHSPWLRQPAAENVVYTDKDGHIGFVAAGRVPVRRQVFDQSLLPTSVGSSMTMTGLA